MENCWNPGFPVLIYKKGMELPPNGTYFVVAGNGLWMHKDTGICKCFVPVNNISVLDDLNAEKCVLIDLPHIPMKLVWQIKKFFSLVVEKYSAEAQVTLYFNKDTQEYKVHIPEQCVSHGSVKYKRIGTVHLKGLEGFLRVGTIHSHCDFEAFHSGTDISDEEDFDGLHITFGNNDKDCFTISATVVVNGYRSLIEPEKVLEGIVQREHDCYNFLDITPEQGKLWANDLNKWILNVNSKEVNSFLGLDPQDSEFLDWADDMKSIQLKSTLGNGPFRLISKDNGKVLIETPTGIAELSEHFFQ